MRRFVLAALLAAVIVLLGGCKTRESIHIAISLGGAPWGCVSASEGIPLRNEPERFALGYEPWIMGQVLEKSGIEAKVYLVERDALLTGVRDGTFDAAIGTLAPETENGGAILYTDPCYDDAPVLAYLPGTADVTEEVLKKSVTAAQKGTEELRQLSERMRVADIAVAESREELLRLLQSGEADYAFLRRSDALALSRREPSLQIYEGKALPEPGGLFGHAIAVCPEKEELLSVFNAALADIDQNARDQALLRAVEGAAS